MESKQHYNSIEPETVADPADIMVEVSAPATLQAGYTFNASYGGVIFPVVVPEGGIVQGQKIAVPFNPNTAYAKATATTVAGAWKDDLCNCFTYGVCHPSLLISCCAPLILLGQIMTRLKLDWLARPASDADFKQTFKIMSSIFVIYAVVSTFLSPVDPEEPTPIYSLINFIYGVFLLVITTQVRKIVRERYHIPEQRCIGCEDFCCAFWCSCCTLSQLARQTADYDMDEAAFFTNDGIVKSTRSPVLIV